MFLSLFVKAKLLLGLFPRRMISVIAGSPQLKENDLQRQTKSPGGNENQITRVPEWDVKATNP